MIEILAIGTAWFWVIITTMILLIMWFVEREDNNGWGATVTLVLFGVSLVGLGNWTMFKEIVGFMANHPGIIISLFLAYILLGVIWSFGRWYLYLKAQKRKLKQNGGNRHDIPRFRDEKDRILVWMCYWPISALWTIINNPVHRTFVYCQDELAHWYQGMVDRIFKDFDGK